MAENLLAYAFKDNALQADNVEETFDSLSRFLTKYKKDSSGFEEMLKDLTTIREEVWNREQAFYGKLGVTDYSHLNQKIKKVQDTYKEMLPEGKIMEAIREKFDFIKDLKSATDEEIADAVEQTVNTFLSEEFANNPSLFNQTRGDTLLGNPHQEDAVLFYLQKFLTTQKGERFITKRGGSKVGLGKIIVGYNTKTNKVSASMSGVRLSSDFKKKLSTELNKIITANRASETPINDKKINVYSLDPKAYREQVNAIIHKFIGKEERKGSLININMAQYDLNRSISSTIGYLGELRATLILQDLAPNVHTRGTGNLRDAAKGHEIPIDVVCAANGFQIKNYTLDESSVTFSNRLSSVSWIQNRMQLSGDLKDMLITLFGIYQYNQPIHPKQNEDGGYTKTPPKRLEEYDALYSNIKGLVYELKDLYDSRIPQMMKISDEFSVNGDPMFHSRRLYFNTFFWINKHLVPASWILDRIIESFSRKTEQKIISSYSFELNNKMKYAYLGREHRLNGLSYNFVDMAKKVKAEYNITINLSEFIKD